ncbi:MAG: anthranilate phosphoribosyltransferase, partial [Sphingorhabdus sp.]
MATEMSLSVSEFEALFGQMLDGIMSDAEIKAILIEMAERDETSEEIAGAIRAMRARMIRVTAPEGAID